MLKRSRKRHTSPRSRTTQRGRFSSSSDVGGLYWVPEPAPRDNWDVSLTRSRLPSSAASWPPAPSTVVPPPTNPLLRELDAYEIWKASAQCQTRRGTVNACSPNPNPNPTVPAASNPRACVPADLLAACKSPRDMASTRYFSKVCRTLARRRRILGFW